MKLISASVRSGPPQDALVHLAIRSITISLRLSRGKDALEALAVLGVNPDTSQPSAVSGVYLLWLQASALTILDRFDEALLCIEQMLVVGPEDPMAPIRLLLAHYQLAEITRLRGWYDECESQVQCALVRTGRSSVDLSAKLHLLRATCRTKSGKYEDAKSSIAEAYKLSRDSEVRERATIVESAILVAEQKLDSALNKLTTASRSMEGNLELTYQHAAVLKLCGNQSEAKTKFCELAMGFPEEHWGRLAASSQSQS